MQNKTEEVRNWWNKNPFTMGLVDNGDMVGEVDLDKVDLNYFNEIERKFRKHSRFGGQEDGAPLLSRLVDYKWLVGKDVLDIAVGSGFSAVSFAAGGANVTGIDLTDFAVKQAQLNFKFRSLPGKILRMDAQEMSFPDCSFDFVDAWGCLMHMPNTEKAIREIYRVTKNGGKFLGYMYNRNSWTFWFNFVLLRGILLGKLIKYRFNINKLTSRYTDGSISGEGNPLAKLYTVREVTNMFEQAGFVDVKCFPWYLPDEPDGWPCKKCPVFKFLPKGVKEFLGKKLAFGLIIQCNKK